jgi:dTDP-4-amino-4,6-dideoxygalactose transaminase
MVKFLDLKTQLPSIKDEIMKKFEDIIENTAFISGKHTRNFERAFAEYLGAKHCIGLNSGTSALIVALMAIGLKAGDEVIIPANTFIATAEAVSILGGRPVLVDIEPRTYNIDVVRLEDVITKNTKAIIPVHLYGQCTDMDSILEIAQRHNLYVIEDACQAHGAEYKGKKAGTIGHIGCFSFYPGKNLGAWGEAGAAVTSNDTLAEKMFKIRNHGGTKKYEHDVIGGNFRMEEFQGAVLSVKLRYLDDWNEARRRNAQLYREHLSGIKEVSLPKEAPYGRHVYHLYVIRAEKTDELQQYLSSKGIDTLIHYPIPIHLQNAYKSLGHKIGDFPVTEKVSKEILSLPMFPELSHEEIEYVCKNIRDFFRA